jgi:hypothetical protein
MPWLDLDLAAAQNRPFTVLDDIALTHFGDLYGADSSAVTPSPDGRFVVIHSEHGVLEENRLEDELRIYDMEELQHFVNGTEQTAVPRPVWTVQESNRDGGDGCVIRHIRWLSDSTAIAFLLRTSTGRVQLLVADIRSREVSALTPADRNVTGFEIRDRNHYVFSVAAKDLDRKLVNDGDVAYVVKDKQMIWDFLLPKPLGDRSELWAATGGPASPVMDSKTGLPFMLYSEGIDDLALSPDGKTIVTAFAVRDIPKEWEARFPPPYPNDNYRLRSGRQDLTSPYGLQYVSQYVSISLKDGAVTPLIGTPTAVRAGWWETASAAPVWSDSGQTVILPGVYPNQGGSDAKPCIAVMDLAFAGSFECVRSFKRNLANGFEPGYKKILHVSFVEGRRDEVAIEYLMRDPTSNDLRKGVEVYARSGSSRWKLSSDQLQAPSEAALNVEIRMNFKDPPRLMATDKTNGRSRVIWDPNPQLKDLELGEPSLYHWKDRTGRVWNAILYKPSGYVPGKRYPLVIETHGFNESLFEPSGGFPSAFAAQELASAGIMVLHMQDCAGRGTPAEGPCNVMGYESGVAQLAKEGLVDGDRIGIIGFSRSVFYVVEALTTSSLHFRAASITDGISLGYVEYILDSGSDSIAHEYLGMLGAPPFGPGLRHWLETAPDFNMNKVTAPVRVVGTGDVGSLSEWEPYALLREMHKAVEFTILNTDEHIITNPAIRLAAQSGNVDWFRFWLQGYEDPDPSKVEQYGRWEAMRKAQEAGKGGSVN